MREVVAASRAPSFEGLVQLIEEVGTRLADAGTKGRLSSTRSRPWRLTM